MGVQFRDKCYTSSDDLAFAIKSLYPMFSTTGSTNTSNFALIDPVVAQADVKTGHIMWTHIIQNSSQIKLSTSQFSSDLPQCTPKSDSNGGIFSEIAQQDLTVYIALAFAFIIGIVSGKFR